MNSSIKNQLNETINKTIQSFQTQQQTTNDSGMSDIDYQNLISTALVKAGLPENKFNTLIELAKDKITCNDACQKERTAQSLKEKMDKLQNDFNNYETNLETSERNYYALQGTTGDNKYNELLNERQAKKTAVFINTQITSHNEIKEELDTLITTLNTSKTNGKTLDDFLEIKLKEKQDLEKEIENYKSVVQTSDRKVEYELDDFSTSKFYRKILMFIFYLLLVLYFIYSDFFPSQKYKHLNTWIMLSFYIIFPYTIDFFIKILFGILNYIKNKY
jgi:hypothetical protein